MAAMRQVCGCVSSVYGSSLFQTSKVRISLSIYRNSHRPSVSNICLPSLRIPPNKVFRPFPHTNDEFTVMLYQLKKNLELRRYVPFVPLFKILQILVKREEPISSCDASTLLSMTGEVLNIQTHRRGGCTSMAWDALKSHKGYDLDLSNYTSYLMACKENKLTIDIHSVHRDMAKAGLTADQGFYDELVGYYCVAGEMGLAYDVMDKMTAANIPLTHNTFNHCILGLFIQKRRVNQWDRVISRMSALGLKPDLNIYMTMMKCHAAMGDFASVLKVIQEAEELADMRKVHRLHLMLPLRANNHRDLASKVMSGLCLPGDSDKADANEIEYCGNQLVTHFYIEEGFAVYKLSDEHTKYFIRSFVRGPGSERRYSCQPIHQRAAELTVQLHMEKHVNLRRLLREMVTISKGYTACVLLELKKQGIVSNSKQITAILDDGYLKYQAKSKQEMKLLAELCLDGDSDVENISDMLLQKGMDIFSAMSVDETTSIHNESQGLAKKGLFYQVRHSIAAELENGNNSEVRRLYEEFHDEIIMNNTDPWKWSRIAKLAHIVWISHMDRKNYTEALYFQKEMIKASPSAHWNMDRVIRLATKMLQDGQKDGIVQGINDYANIVMKAPAGRPKLGQAIIGRVMDTLVNIVQPVEAMTMLRVLSNPSRPQKNTLIKTYLKRDSALGVEALCQLVTKKSVKVPYIEVLSQIVKEMKKPLEEKACHVIVKFEGQYAARVYLMCAYLWNDQVEHARAIHKEMERDEEKTRRPIFFCLVFLKEKPDMLNAFLQIAYSPHLREVLVEYLTKREGQVYSDLRDVFRIYSIENPDSVTAGLYAQVLSSNHKVVDQEVVDLEKLMHEMKSKV